MRAKRAFRAFDWGLKQPQRRKSFFVNLCIGIIVGVVFYFLSHLAFMESLFNATVDKMIYWESFGFVRKSEMCRQEAFSGSGDCVALKQRMSDYIVFIDMDDSTLVEWGDPFFLPRDRLARIIRLAEENGARVLIFDVLLDAPSNVPEADKELRNVLNDMTRRRSSLSIVFPVLKAKRDGRAMRNIFDDYIDTNPHFHRAIPYVSASPSDKTVRYIRYYETVRGPRGEQHVLWGTHVLGAFLYMGDEKSLTAIEAGILDDVAKGREGRYVVRGPGGQKVVMANSEFFSNRIRFAFIPPGVLGGQGNLFTERMTPEEVDPLRRNLKDKIVIVGTSSPDKEPWYKTPVGDMPGMYIIGNATNMLLGGWQVRDAPLWLKGAMWLLVVLFAAYMFANLDPSSARIASVCVLFALFVPVTLYFFWKQNVMMNATLLFVNALLPMLAMGWEKVPNAAVKVLKKRKRKGP